MLVYVDDDVEIINTCHIDLPIKVELMWVQDPLSSPCLHEDFQPTHWIVDRTKVAQNEILTCIIYLVERLMWPKLTFYYKFSEVEN